MHDDTEACGADLHLAGLRCGLCGAVESSLRFRVDGCPIYRCAGCGVLISPTDAALRETYGRDYYESDRRKGGYANYVAAAPINRLTFARRLDELERRLGRRGRILDVGCALGDCLLVARERGWETVGLEISAHAGSFARERRGLEVLTGSIADACFAPSSFDGIVLYDVLEHLDAPVTALRRLARWLRPDGLLHVVTPNVEGFSSHLMGRRWYHYKPGEHIYYFSPRTLDRALRAAGLASTEVQPVGSALTPDFALDRLRYYQPELAGLALRLARIMRLQDLVLFARVGEMQAWARAERSTCRG